MQEGLFFLQPVVMEYVIHTLNALTYIAEVAGTPNTTLTTNEFGTYIAFNVDIENLVGSGGNDEITGNSLANTIFANAGNDVIQGELGNDLVYGGQGNDQTDPSPLSFRGTEESHPFYYRHHGV